MAKKAFNAGQLIPTSSTPPSDAGFYRIDKNTIGVVGNMVQKNAQTNVESNVASGANLAAELAALPETDLFSLFPLPTNRTIVDAWNANIVAANLPAGVTIAVEAAADEFGGSVIRIDLPSGLTNQNVIIPILPTRGEQPRALLDVAIRMNVSDWSALTRFYAKIGNAALTEARLWVLINDASGGKSQYGCWQGGVYPNKWNNVYRTLRMNPFSQVTNVGSTAWDENAPELEVFAIGFTVTTIATTTIRLSRAYSPEWKRGAIVQCLDGGYQSAHDYLLSQFASRGWKGTVSRLAADDASYTQDSQWPDFVAAGWDVCQHIAIGSSPLTSGTTDTDVKNALAQFKHYAKSLGVDCAGNYLFSQFLTNYGRYVGQDMAGLLRSSGIQGSRGICSDAEYGIDPFHAKFDSVGWSSFHQQGFIPKHGRYNRWFIDSSDLATPELRNTYQGSGLQRLVAAVAAGKSCGINYIHRIQAYDGTSPTVNNVGLDFFASYIADLDARFASRSVVPISASQLDSITYSRPGDVYVRWDGEWVSRTTGKIAF